VDVYLGGSNGPAANPPIKIMEDVPCTDLAQTLQGLIRHGAFKAMRQQLRKIPQTISNNGVRPPGQNEPARSMIDAREISEGSAKLLRAGGEEMAVFKFKGQLYGIQNICPHEGGQFCNGWIDGGEVVCPLHGYKFNLKTGACSTDPKLKVKVFKLVSQGDQFTLEG
jgi:nitrite reductase/ring-hydroxylating ferredoxin subunit